MALGAALGIFLLAAAALPVAVGRAGSRLPSILGTLAAILSAISLLGRIYGSTELTGLGAGTLIAPGTAIALAALALGLFAKPAVRSPFETLGRATPGGRLARSFTVASLTILPMLGALDLAGVRAGLFESAFGVSLVVACGAGFLAVAGVLLAARFEQLETKLQIEEDRLADLHEMNEKLIDSLPMGVTAYRADGQCVLANPTAGSLVGATQDALLSQNYLEIESWKNSGLFDQAARTVRTGESLTSERHHYSTFGVESWLRTTTVAFSSQGERHLLFLFLDTTEQRRAEIALRQSLELFRNSIEHALNGIALVSTEGSWLQVNPALRELLGYGEEELTARNMADSMPPKDAALVAGVLHDLATGSRTAVHNEAVLVRKDGLEVPVLQSMSLVRGDNGVPLYLVAQFQDISQIRRTMADLHRSNEELEQFAYIVSHDLRAPLRAIRNLVGWISEDLGGESALVPEVGKNIGLLQQRTDRLDALIEGILQYSRIGREPNPSTEIDPEQLVRDIWGFVSPSASIKLSVQCPIETIHAAEVPLSLVLRNLLDNAAKHNRLPNGNVLVTVAEEARFYRFDIADDGPGIPAEHRDRIFRIFETLQPKDAIGTVGVGLALVRKTVTHNGGSVEVLDNPAGRGALFRVLWPKPGTAIPN
jgi:PAS domain S-box-containing protein